MNRPGSQGNRQIRFRWRYLLILYIILLIASQAVRVNLKPPVDTATDRPAARFSIDAAQPGQRFELVLVYDDHLSPSGDDRVPVVLVDGMSPVSASVSRELVSILVKSGRVIAPDLTATASAAAPRPDPSARSQAVVLLALLDHLRIDAAHLVAFDMGGPVAANMAHLAPARVTSISMVSAVGVQEFELLGSHHINRALYGGRLALLWFIRNAIPHMGLLDAWTAAGVQVRVRYESDLRPVRQYFETFSGPMLIVQKSTDRHLSTAARELARIVPQSELIRYRPAGIGQPGYSRQLAAHIDNFIGQVEDNRAATRDTAATGRIAAAARPLSSLPAAPISGYALLMVVILLAAATLISEDLTCIAAGLLVARGTIGFVPAVGASFAGILIGDILLFLAGRFLGRPALKVVPFKWLVKEADIQRTSDWFSARGPVIILSSRFMPGLRLPTYFAAGVLRTRFRQFLFYFAVAVALWTPLLVGLSAIVGNRMFAYYDLFGRYAIVIVIATVALLWATTRIVARLFSYRGRRLLLSSFRRLTRWEFWPPMVFYLPVLGYYSYLAARFRSLTVFTACNPGIPEGGFRETSQSRILDHLTDAEPAVARYRLVRGSESASEKIRQATDFMRRFNLAYPVVLKADVDRRGTGVAIIRSKQQLAQQLGETKWDQIIQEYARGREFSIFYCRYPDKNDGRIFSIAEKRRVTLRGDGRSTLEQLILQDDRTVCMAPFYLQRHRDKLFTILHKGEEFTVVQVGTRCRGAWAPDSGDLRTPSLEAVMDRVSKQVDGIYFGRYDVVTPSTEDLRKGRYIKIVALNGVTFEAAHLYGAGTSLWRAYGTVMRQWRLTFDIGAINVRRGHQPTPLKKIPGLLIRLVTGPRPLPAEENASSGRNRDAVN